MKKLLYFSLIAMSVILMACPYEGDVKLCTYDEALKADKKLLDIWVAFNEDGGRDEILIEKGNKSVLFLTHKSYEKGNKLNEIQQYRAFATLINEEMIFTIEDKSGKYIYSKFAWTSKNEIDVQFINDDFMNNNFKVDSVTTKNMVDFLTKNLSSEGLFTDKMEFYRKYSYEYQKVKVFMQKSGF